MYINNFKQQYEKRHESNSATGSSVSREEVLTLVLKIMSHGLL